MVLNIRSFAILRAVGWLNGWLSFDLTSNENDHDAGADENTAAGTCCRRDFDPQAASQLPSTAEDGTGSGWSWYFTARRRMLGLSTRAQWTSGGEFGQQQLLFTPAGWMSLGNSWGIALTHYYRVNNSKVND